MPLFEFKCMKCKVQVEKLQDSLMPPTCSTCEVEMHHIISVSNFALRGGGWYRDGYQKK